MQISHEAALRAPATLGGLLLPAAVRNRTLADAILVAGGAAFVALCAQIVVPLPFTPVPLTGQTLAVLLVGAGLGASRAVASMLLYLAVGLLGAPVFAEGAAGWAALSGPTAGYLLGFVVAAAAIGWMAERHWDRRFATALCAMAVGSALIYAAGCTGLAVALDVTPARALELGLYPFVAGDLVKLALGAGLLSLTWLAADRIR